MCLAPFMPRSLRPVKIYLRVVKSEPMRMLGSNQGTRIRRIKVFGLFKSRKHTKVAQTLYASILIQARLPVFYTDYGVQDTIDGRFDMIILHAHILFNRLKGGPAEEQEIAQAVFDMMFADMDQNLREMGVGDVGVSKRIKAMAEAFYGRATAYANGMREHDNSKLIAALRRNLYRNSEASDQQIIDVSSYIRNQVAHLKSQQLSELLHGNISFMPAEKREV
jgi:cytochrome b pre-mRNA-processing protein 3